MPSIQDAMKSAGVVKPNPTAGSYFDEKGNLKVEFVSKANMEPMARKFAEEKLNMAQLRRFFNNCREIERRLRSNQSTFEHEQANIARLSVFAADAAGKYPPKIPRSFRDFLDKNVAMIHSKKDFVDGFMQHFEALVGFATLYMREERNR